MTISWLGAFIGQNSPFSFLVTIQLRNFADQDADHLQVYQPVGVRLRGVKIAATLDRVGVEGIVSWSLLQGGHGRVYAGVEIGGSAELFLDVAVRLGRLSGGEWPWLHLPGVLTYLSLVVAMISGTCWRRPQRQGIGLRGRRNVGSLLASGTS